MLAFNLQLRELLAPVTGTAGGSVRRRPTRCVERHEPRGRRNRRSRRRRRATKAAAAAAAKPPVAVPMATAESCAAARSILDEPAPRSNQSPVSQTVWTGPLDGGSRGAAARRSRARTTGTARAAAEPGSPAAVAARTSSRPPWSRSTRSTGRCRRSSCSSRVPPAAGRRRRRPRRRTSGGSRRSS